MVAGEMEVRGKGGFGRGGNDMLVSWCFHIMCTPWRTSRYVKRPRPVS